MLGKPLSIASKLVITGAVFLILALSAIGVTLWIAWKLEGGAGAINESGRLRMLTFRMALAAETGAQQDLRQLAGQFDRTLELLSEGDVTRPLFVPWTEASQARLQTVRQQWLSLSGQWLGLVPQEAESRGTQADLMVSDIDLFVRAIEAELTRWSAILNLAQLMMLGLALSSAVALLYVGYLVVLDPLARLRTGIEHIERGDFTYRVDSASRDEFGRLSDGFNRMSEALHTLYGELEQKVREKTSRLEQKQQRLAALYEVSALLATQQNLREMANGFARKLRPIAGADAVAIRWSDAAHARFVLLGADCLPQQHIDSEQCISRGQCHCGESDPDSGTRVIRLRVETMHEASACLRAGFQSIVVLPISMQGHQLGEVELFFRSEPELQDEDRQLLESLVNHLAGAMESLRVDALKKEAAVAEERGLLARELHDSIAQSLVFLKMQLQMLRDALRKKEQNQAEKVLGELDTGLRECTSDVRELLIHFRTRTNQEDIEPALRATVQKFEHQTGLRAHLTLRGSGLPLAPDVQVQVLHVIQEALSNVRKHSGASEVWIDVDQTPSWCFEIRDQGVGFVFDEGGTDQTHVGLRIMRERAASIGAELIVDSAKGGGTSITLALPMPPIPQSQPQTPAELSAAS